MRALGPKRLFGFSTRKIRRGSSSPTVFTTQGVTISRRFGQLPILRSRPILAHLLLVLKYTRGRLSCRFNAHALGSGWESRASSRTPSGVLAPSTPGPSPALGRRELKSKLTVTKPEQIQLPRDRHRSRETQG